MKIQPEHLRIIIQINISASSAKIWFFHDIKPSFLHTFGQQPARICMLKNSATTYSLAGIRLFFLSHGANWAGTLSMVRNRFFISRSNVTAKSERFLRRRKKSVFLITSKHWPQPLKPQKLALPPMLKHYFFIGSFGDLGCPRSWANIDL